MRAWLQDAGVRLWIAAGLSLVLHTGLAVSWQRLPGGSSPLQAEATRPGPLMARLATAVGVAVFPDAAAPVAPAPADEATTPRPDPAVSASAATAGSDVQATGQTYYFKSSELDLGPYPLQLIVIPAPPGTEEQTGRAVLRLRISERGRVDEATVITGSGIAEFDAAALREFTQSDFRPGVRARLPVRSEILVEVRLDPPPKIEPEKFGAEKPR